LIKAKAVFIVEGEKDVETLQGHGLVGTTNAGGADAWNDAYAPFFKDKRVVIIPDNDEPGRRHAIKVTRSILPVAETVRIVELPDIPPKGDVTDYLSNHVKSDLVALINATKPITASDLDATSQSSSASLDDSKAEIAKPAKQGEGTQADILAAF